MHYIVIIEMRFHLLMIDSEGNDIEEGCKPNYTSRKEIKSSEMLFSRDKLTKDHVFLLCDALNYLSRIIEKNRSIPCFCPDRAWLACKGRVLSSLISLSLSLSLLASKANKWFRRACIARVQEENATPRAFRRS